MLANTGGVVKQNLVTYAVCILSIILQPIDYGQFDSALPITFSQSPVTSSLCIRPYKLVFAYA